MPTNHNVWYMYMWYTVQVCWDGIGSKWMPIAKYDEIVIDKEPLLFYMYMYWQKCTRVLLPHIKTEKNKPENFNFVILYSS